MKTISHKTKELVLGQVLNQNRVQIGSDAGTISGILFNNGKEHFPGIRFNKESGWEYSLDGLNWIKLDDARLSFEPIVVQSSNMVDGTITIKHNLGVKYLLGLDYSVIPDQVDFVDENTLRLSFTSSPNEVVIWFNQSKQSMLSGIAELTTGLMAYWPFDEDTDATVAVDEMGRFNLTRMSSNNFGGCVGKMGGCWGRPASAFTGLAASEMISADEYQTGFTFNGWYKLQSGKSRGWTQLIGISKNANGGGEDGGSLGIHLGYGESRLHFSASSDRASLEDQSVTVYPITNPTDRWIMVTGVYDKSTNTAKVYLDGVLQNESVLDVQQPSGYLTVLGNDWDNVGSVLVDEFGFWNKPLTEADIASLYNNGAGLALKYLIRGESIPPVEESAIPKEGLVFFAPLTDLSTTTPSGHLLTYKDASNPSPVVKNGIQGLWWDGASKDSGIGVLTSNIASMTTFTISFWECISSAKDDYTPFTFYGSPSSGFFMCLTGNSIYNGSTHIGFSGAAIPPLDEIGHVAITHESNTYKIYVNGEYISSLEEEQKWKSTDEIVMCLGERYDRGSIYGYSFCGMLSHFRIYNRILNDNEIQLLSKEFTPTQSSEEIPTDGLVFYAPLSEEKSTAETGQSFIKYGEILFQTEDGIPCVYMGDGDYYKIESDNLPLGGSDRTLSCWVKYSSNEFSTSQEVFGYGFSDGPSTTFYLGAEDPNKYRVYGAGGTTVSTGDNYELTKWHHVAVTYSNGVHAVFVDGRKANVYGQYTRNTKNGPIRIGAYDDEMYFHFSGFVAACRLYNRVLNNIEIRLLSKEFTPNQ